MKRMLSGLINVFVALFMVGMLVTVSAPQPVMAAALVDLVLVPSTPAVTVGDSVNVTVEVQAGATGVDGITITMDYDPAYLQFQSWILPAVNNYEVAMLDTTSTPGEADYGRATFGTAPSGTFDFVTITFLTLAVTTSTPIDFHRVAPRATSALVGITEGLNNTTGANVTIGLGVIDHIVISPDMATITAGDNQTYTAKAFNAAGGNATVTAETTFEIVEAGHGGSWTNNIYTAAKAGTWTVKGTYSSQTDTATLTVNQGPVDHIVISTGTPTITNVDTAAFTSTSFDAGSNSENVTANTTFTIEAGAGGSWTNNVYTAGNVGTWTVTGNHTASGKVDTATLTVENPVDLVLRPSSPTVTIGDTVDVTVEVQAATGVDGITITMDYDPAYLAFQSWALPAVNYYEVAMLDTTSTPGEADYGRATFGTAPSGTFDFVIITFEALAITTSTPIDFHRVAPRATSALVGITEGLDTTTGANVTVDVGVIDHIIVSPSAANITAGSTQTYIAEAYNAAGGHINVTSDTTFSIDAAAGGTWTGSYSNVYNAEKVGNWTVTATHTPSGKTDTATLKVEGGTIVNIVLSPATATISTDDTQTYTTAASDNYTNSWDVTANTTFSIDASANGSWTNNVYTPEVVGTWTVTANHTASGKNDTATLIVEGGAIVSIVLSPASTSITADNTQAYTVEAYDGVGQHWDVTSSTTFSINATAGGSWAANVYTAEKVGDWTVTGTHTPSSVSGTAALTVVAGALDYIVISPSTKTVTAGETANYTAEAFDQHNNTRGDVTSPTVFSIDTLAGGSWTGADSNVYTAQKVGTWTVTGTYSTKTDTASLTVNRAHITGIMLSPSSVSITADDTQTFILYAYDAYSNSWLVTADNFTITSGAGGSWAANVYTPEKVGTWTVTAAYSGVSPATATLTVTVGVLHHIQVTPSTANVTAGVGTTDFTAWGLDQRNNSRGDITATSTWTSSDPGKASIESKGQTNPGRATGHNQGTVTIKAAKGRAIPGTATLNVEAATIASIEVTADRTTITLGSTQQFQAWATYTDASVVDITTSANWTSDNTSVADIGLHTGLATSIGKSEGVTDITVWMDGVTSSPAVTLTVTAAELQSIAVTQATANITAGETQQFTAIGTFSYGPTVDLTKSVTWSSNNETVATIKAGGLAISYAAGTATITATSSNSTGTVSGNTALTVTAAVLVDVAVTPDDPTITFVAGDPPTIQFTATAIYSDGSTADSTGTATWNSGTPATANITTTGGLATALAGGTSTISATVGVKTGTSTLTVLPDKVAPVVTLTSPSEGLIISSANLTVIGNVDDVNAVVTTIIVNDVATANVTLDASGDFNANVTLNAGSNTILVRASDSATPSNTGVSATRTVKVDPKKPDISITLPVGGTLTKTASITVTGTIVGATSATLRLNGRVVTTTLSGSFSQGVTLVEGRNSIVVSGYATGHSANDPDALDWLGTSGVRMVRLDTTAPVVTIDSPTPGSVVRRPGIRVSGTVDDPLVSSANLTVRDATGAITVSKILRVVDGSFRQRVRLTEGANTITIMVTDWENGNTSSATLSGVEAVTFDKTKPQVNIITPANRLLTNVGGTLVTGNVSDPLSIATATLYVNNVSQPLSVAPDGSFSQMAALTAGPNKIRVEAIDTAGNKGKSGEVHVKLDSTPPVVTLGLSDPTDSIILTVTSSEALAGLPTTSVNATAVTMTRIASKKWDGTYPATGVLANTQYSVTATGNDTAGNPATATAIFSKQAVTIAANTTQEVKTDTTTLAITTNTTVQNQSISVTQHTENPAKNAESEIEAGIFVEIVASANLTDSIASVNITVAYDEDEIIARGIDESTLRLYLWNVTIGKWELVPGSSVNVTGNYIFGTVTHLSKYGAFGGIVAPTPPPPPPVIEDEDAAPPATVIVTPGIYNLSQIVTADGVFTVAAKLDSADGKVALAIAQGTIGKTKTDRALSTIKITEVVEPPAPPVGASIVGLTYDLGPDGATFTPAIALTMTYDPGAIPEGVNEGALVIAMWNEAAGEWVELEGGTVDPVAHTITAPIGHFTTFAIIAPAPVEEVVPPVEEVVPPVEEVVPPVVEEAPPVVEEVPPVVEEAPPVVEEVPPVVEEVPPPAPEGIAWWVWLIIGLAVVAVIGGVIWWVLRRRAA